LAANRSSTILGDGNIYDTGTREDIPDIPSIQIRHPSPIDVDSIPDFPAPCEVVTESSGTPRHCEGIAVDLPPTVSPHSAYPFSLHDEMGDPWDYSVTQGILVLRARSCQKIPKGGGKQCRNCKVLSESSMLQGIVNRIEMGVHENSRLCYHGIGGLVKIVRQKTGQVQALRLRRLNDARKLTAKATALENHKQWMMAIGSGKVERVDRLVRAGISRKVGIRGMLNLYDRTAQKVYRTQNYTEEDALRGLLLWCLGGSRVAAIAHKALDLPSISTLRRKTVVTPIVVSPRQPVKKEVEKNVSACFEKIVDVVEAKRIVHQVLMLDEIKVEERPRWDDKTNMILGPCREHGEKTSLEFNSRHEAELLVEALCTGEVHLAGKVQFIYT
jgi:hypothetical protein